MYKTNSQIKFKTSTLMSSLRDYSDACILVNRTVTIIGDGAEDNAKRLDERYKGELFKNCASFVDCISEINNTRVHNAKDLDVLISMYNLIEYCNNY